MSSKYGENRTEVNRNSVVFKTFDTFGWNWESDGKNEKQVGPTSSTKIQTSEEWGSSNVKVRE